MLGWRQIGAVSLACVLAATAIAQDAPTLSDMPSADAYDQCIGLIDGDPERAFEAALAWRDLDGGLPSRHCVALALVALESYKAAATRLEELADDMKGFPTSSRAEVLAQAGRAWFLAKDAQRAYAAVTAGLQIDSDNVELLIDRGEILAVAQSYWDALDDFNRVLELSPERIDALIFRATAYRLVDAAELAIEDIDKALAMAPGHPEALIERGILRRLQGDTEGARQDWLRVIRVAPDSRAAAIARANIERMDVAGR